MKHSFVQKMEDVLDNESEISHESLSTEVEGVVIDPNKIGVKISTDSVDTCYNPIIQSGGKYDIKVSAYSNQDKLSADIIIASLGARYKGYCATLSRTYMIDAVPKVEKTYATLLALYNHCLEQIIVGMEFKTVVEKAKSFVAERDSSLSVCLPKTLGFCIGLEFRDGSLTLNDKNTTTFKQGMVLALSVGFHNVPLSAEDKDNASVQVKKLNTFSLLLADTIKVVSEGPAEVLTKSSKEFSDVSYKLPDKDDEEEDDDMKNDDDGLRRSKRSREEKLASENAAVQRAERQKELMKKKVEEAQRKLAGKSNDNDEDNDDSEEVNDLSVYRSPEDYPKDIMPNQLKVDLVGRKMKLEAVALDTYQNHIEIMARTRHKQHNPNPVAIVSHEVPKRVLKEQTSSSSSSSSSSSVLKRTLASSSSSSSSSIGHPSTSNLVSTVSTDGCNSNSNSNKPKVFSPSSSRQTQTQQEQEHSKANLRAVRKCL